MGPNCRARKIDKKRNDVKIRLKGKPVIIGKGWKIDNFGNLNNSLTAHLSNRYSLTVSRCEAGRKTFEKRWK
jgi:hypothetical protein